MMLPRRDPYLWLHLAGLATVPLWLDICLAGLEVGEAVLTRWLELITLGGVGTVPILWMQWQRPFYIFSLLVLALRPDTLSEDRQRLLSQQRTWLSRGLVTVSAIALLCILFWLYQLAPLAANMTPFVGQPRAIGWLICAIAFLLANLFVQVPAMVVALLLVPPDHLSQLSAYNPERILQDFTVLGLRVRQILPDWSEIPDATTASPTSGGEDTVTKAAMPPVPNQPDQFWEASPECLTEAEPTPLSVPTAPEDLIVEAATGPEVVPSSAAMGQSESFTDQTVAAAVHEPQALASVSQGESLVTPLNVPEAALFVAPAIAPSTAAEDGPADDGTDPPWEADAKAPAGVTAATANPVKATEPLISADHQRDLESHEMYSLEAGEMPMSEALATSLVPLEDTEHLTVEAVNSLDEIVVDPDARTTEDAAAAFLGYGSVATSDTSWTSDQ
jgi:hypothetical protein